MAPDETPATLAGIRERIALVVAADLNADALNDVYAAMVRLARDDSAVLLKAVEAVLELHAMQETPVLCWDHVCDVHRDHRGLAGHPPPRDCPDCRFTEMRVCSHCSCPNDEWPCPTREAITAALAGEEAT